jgi:hypothetical protein
MLNATNDQTLPPDPQPTRDDTPPEHPRAPVATDTAPRTVATPQRPAQSTPGPFAFTRGDTQTDAPVLHAETPRH